MAFTHGKYTRVAYEGFDLTKFFNDASSTSTVDTAETSVFLDQQKSYVVGHTDGTVSMSGMFDADPDGNADKVDDVLSSVLGTENGLGLVLPQGDLNGVGSRALFFTSKNTSYEISSALTDVVAVSTELQSSGGIHYGVYLRDSVSGAGYQSVTGGAAATEGSSVNDGAASASGAVGHLQVTANSLDAALTVKIQESADDAAWSDLITFTSVVAADTTAEQITVTGSVAQYVRALVDASTSTTGSAEVAVAFKRV